MSPGMHSMMASMLFICSLASGMLPAPLRAQAPDVQSGAIASINALDTLFGSGPAPALRGMRHESHKGF